MPAGPAATLPPLSRHVWWVAGVLFVVLMALSPLYGFHRDELYFLDAGRHLQLSYVDQPVLVPLLARVSLDVFGVTLPGLRLWPALAGLGTVVVAGLTARELGGARRAQVLAAIAVATMPALLAIDHLHGPTAVDLLVWAAIAWVLLRVGRTGNPRLWVVAGALVGIGVANKHSVVFFAATLTGALLAVGGWRLVANRWFALGVVVALAGAVPELVWQSRHGWATVEMTRNLNAENGGAANIPVWLVGQLIIATPAMVPVWLLGLRHLWRARQPAQRAIAIAYAVLCVFFAVTTGAKIYYLAGAYVPLLAAGAVVVDERLRARQASSRRLLQWTAVTTLLAAPIVLPVLPANLIGWTYAINQVPGESVGWDSFVRNVRAEWSALPSASRERTALVTVNYGEAGALNELQRPNDLPTAYGTHNTEWWWGPPPTGDVDALVVAPSHVTAYDVRLRRFFRNVRLVRTLHNPQGIHNEEWGARLYLCSGRQFPWSVVWPQLRHYG